MRAAGTLTVGCGAALVAAVALGGCGRVKQNDPQEDARLRAQAKRQQVACASPAAYDRLKGILFDQAIEQHDGNRGNLDTLADYSFARMEDPVVKGSDPALDITRCKGRFILDIPPGAERAFAGQRHLEANIDYTAQAAANGNGFVYQLSGGDQIVGKLAAFNLTSSAYRPSPAIDQPQTTTAPERTAIARADAPAQTPRQQLSPAQVAPVVAERQPEPLPRRPAFVPERTAPPVVRQAITPRPAYPGRGTIDGTGEAAVRAFYDALGADNGAAASARVVPEKRASAAFSPAAISRFYGRLPEPIRLTQIEALSGGAYRVRYHYSAGRSRCNGGAIVTLTRRDGRDLIRSIRPLSGC